MIPKKIAFVHDWLTGMRGGEKVLEAACELFPDAEIYTLIHRPDRISGLINSKGVHVSWLNSLPGVHRYYRYLLPLMPSAIRGFDLGDCDLVLSFNHCVAKGVPMTRRPGKRRPLHICYCHTPMRYVYDEFHAYFADGSRAWLKRGAGWLRPHLMRWDKKTSRGVDLFIANSENVRQRIQKAYTRDSAVIHPPVDTGFFTPSPPGGGAGPRPYYLSAGALVPYKRVDLAIAACRRLNAPLKIVGVGTEEQRLRRLAAGAPVEFLGWQSGEALRELYRDCEALLFPQNEDFGITPVEAMACGRPVIAYKKGGALETVIEGVTGTLFDAQTPKALADAMQRARQTRFEPAAIRSHALQFDVRHFKSRLAGFVEQAWEKHAQDQAAVEKKVRVLQVLECGGPGGTGNQVAAICNGLDADRFETVLVYSVRPGNEPEQYRATAAGARSAYHVPEMVREISPWNDARAFLRLIRILRKERPDVVHAHSSKAGVLARLAAWLCRVPRIYYSPHGYSFLQTDRSSLARLYYWLLEFFVSAIGEIVAVSPGEAQLARKLSWGKPVHTVCDPYLGPAEPPALRAHEGLVVGACGRLTEARNPEAFIRLAAELCRRGPAVRCVWIGSGELEATARGLVQGLGLAARFEFTGWLKPGEVLERLRGLDVFVHYSRWEGLPNAVLEAMALGLPAVVSDVPGNRDAVQAGVTGFLAKDEAGLRDAVSRLLKDPQLRRCLGQAGRERIRREFTPAKAIALLQGLYRQDPTPG
ncbi:MAG: glycosyltransferase [Elusimicrobia bacterium]|nr:glycosyltransferase [Elusimicrobiota bacterium]